MYPRLLRRVRAGLIDSLIFAVLIYVWVFSLDLLEGASVAMKVAPFVAALLVMEPGLVAWTGGTVGHHVMGLRVRDATRECNLGLLRAIVRAAGRSLLGWVSLIFVLVTHRHQASHDYMSGSVVVLRNPERMPDRERISARVIPVPEGFELPGARRRPSVIVLWSVVSLVTSSVIESLVLSRPCVQYRACGGLDRVLSISFTVLWFAVFVAIIVHGWRGQLYGCRRRKRKVDG